MQDEEEEEPTIHDAISALMEQVDDGIDLLPRMPLNCALA
jgi:hypothetical protein